MRRRVPAEDLAVLAACLLASLLVGRRLLAPDVLEGDATVHLAWMWHWRDGRLFDDDLTALLRESARYPWGYQAAMWLATQAADPIAFSEWLGIVLMGVSGWLVFRVTREQAAWRPAAWLAAALFLALFDVHRFSGGFPRAFVQPFVLLTVLLLLRRRLAWAAVVAAAAALVYPPAAVLAVGSVLLDAVRWDGRQPRPDRERAPWALLACGLAAAAVLGPRLAGGAAPEVLSAAQAHRFAELGPGGTLRFFAPTTLEYLRQNRSGFDLRLPGSIVVVAALALLLARPANARLLRRPVVAMGVAAVGAWALAQLVLFRLYLPHRYTYPLVALAPIVVATALHPTWVALQARPRATLRGWALLCSPLAVVAVALVAFPLGPLRPAGDVLTTRTVAGAVVAALLAAGLVAALRRRPAATRAAVLAGASGVALLALLLAVPSHPARGWTCPQTPVVRHLASLPPGAVIAGDPLDLNCLPASTHRAVVISAQLAPAYETAYLLAGRERMFATLRAMYGPSRQAVDALRRFGATDLWVRRDALGGRRWRGKGRPYAGFVRRLVATGATPAVLRLPRACRRFRHGPDEVYDLRCVAGR